MKNTIYIMPLAPIAPIILEEIQKVIKRVFNCDVKFMQCIMDPEYAYEPKRQQYFSFKILEWLSVNLPDDGLKIIGITENDLATPVLTFVFGEAQLNGSSAVISLKRLRQEYYELAPNSNLLLFRAQKEVIHELGHTFGLLHCEDTQCVMHFSSNILGIDQKELNFCSQCLEILQNK